MLNHLAIFKNKQEKNLHNKVPHTLLLKEQFNYLKTAHTQKRLFNNSSIYKNILEHFSAILEDNKRFSAEFEKRFPGFFKYLFVIKLITFLFMFSTAHMDYEIYKTFVFFILTGESLIFVSRVFYSPCSFGCYFVIIISEFIISVYVILKSNYPAKNAFFQIGKQALKAAGVSTMIAVVYCKIGCIESDFLTNFVHTKTPFGRGYDYEIGSYDVVVKGDMISSFLGPEDMVRAVEKHAPDSHIIDINKLSNIINDPEFKSKIRKNTTFAEKAALGIPLFDISSST